MTFEQILIEYNGMIWGIVNKYSVKGFEKDDLYQEATTKLWEEYKKYNDDYKFSTFMYSVLNNHLSNLSRESQTQRRCNKINGKAKKDVKDYDFSIVIENTCYTTLERYELLKAFELLEDEKHKEIILSLLKNTQVLFEYQVCDVYICFKNQSSSVYLK